MLMSDILKWAKSVKAESKEKKQAYGTRLPKVENYIEMIIIRAEHIQSNTIKMQQYMSDIEDALVKLSSYGVSVPTAPKEPGKNPENPLKNI